MIIVFILKTARNYIVEKTVGGRCAHIQYILWEALGMCANFNYNYRQ